MNETTRMNETTEMNETVIKDIDLMRKMMKFMRRSRISMGGHGMPGMGAPGMGMRGMGGPGMRGMGDPGKGMPPVGGHHGPMNGCGPEGRPPMPPFEGPRGPEGRPPMPPFEGPRGPEGRPPMPPFEGPRGPMAGHGPRCKRPPLSREHLLVMIGKHPEGIRQKAIADKIGINQSSTSELIGKLETDGYIVRKVDPSDKRATLLFLTELGQARAAEVEDERNAMFEGMFAKLSEEEKQTLSDLLDKLLA